MPPVVKCPQCRVQVTWEGNPHRPFCSERCKLIDLGAWAEERYRIPGRILEDESESGEDEPDENLN
ncbi:MAG: DNA gyrase inhibitor YacG [Deltaproteobacteria bacterium]|nr:DNA gyrase inhibitor YacG [Deltaproteobacteria bacterium]